MPDILIRGADEPKSCRGCLFMTPCGECEGYSDHCILIEDPPRYDQLDDIPDGIPDFCPLIILPEGHGRLIDADALIATCVDEKGGYLSFQGAVAGEVVDGAPTIVPAEKEEVHG